MVFKLFLNYIFYLELNLVFVIFFAFFYNCLSQYTNKLPRTRTHERKDRENNKKNYNTNKKRLKNVYLHYIRTEIVSSHFIILFILYQKHIYHFVFLLDCWLVYLLSTYRSFKFINGYHVRPSIQYAYFVVIIVVPCLNNLKTNTKIITITKNSFLI